MPIVPTRQLSYGEIQENKRRVAAWKANLLTLPKKKKTTPWRSSITGVPDGFSLTDLDI
jgi:hypothetical protein